MPMASAALAIVFAVYIPPQVPAVGHTARSIASRSSSDIRPRAWAPTASKEVTMLTVCSRPSDRRTRPGSREPAYSSTLATSMRAAAMSIAGMLLSQPASVTMPSSRSACITVSTESAITSRLTREKCMPSWPMEMTSETVIVPNSMGKPPACCTPLATSPATSRNDILHGVMLLYDDAMPIWGLSKSSSDMPSARSIPRFGERSRPCVARELRGVMVRAESGVTRSG